MNIQWKPTIFSSFSRLVLRGVSALLLLGMFASSPASAAGNTDLMWVLDDTGSLFSTDPSGLRYQAVQQLMSKLSDGAIVEKAGLAYFAESATIAVPLTAVATAATSIASVTSGTPTSPVRPSYGGVEFYGNAIQGAAAELASHATPTASKVMVMFTDGGSAYTGSYNGVTSVDPVAAAKAARAQGITVNVVLLGPSGSTAPQYITDMVAAGGGKLLMVTSATDLLSTLGSSAVIGVTPPSTPPSTSVEVTKAQTTAVSAQVQRATTIQQAVTIINVLSSIASPRASMGPPRIALGAKKNGMAAGGGADQWNVWMNASRGDVANTFADATVNTSFDGHVDNWIGGLDYGINKDLVVGASVGYDRTSLDTYFNNGSLTSKGTMIAPYISYQINDMFSVDAVIGYATGNSDVMANFGAATGTQDFTRNFAAVNVSAVKWFDSWQLNGKLSYINAQENLNDFSLGGSWVLGQNNRLEQVRLGGQVGYWADGVMPYFGLTYVNDVSTPSSGLIPVPASRDGYTAVVGVNVFGKNLIGSLSYTTEQGRSNTKNNVFMGSLSYRF